MKKQIITILAVALATVFELRGEKVATMTPEERAARNARIKEKLKGKTPAELLYMRTGGRIVKPESGEGKIVFLNAQKTWPAGKVGAFAKDLALFFQVRIEVRESNMLDFAGLAKARRDTGAAVALLLIDQPDHPKSLVDYEDCWGVVNLNSFTTKADEKVMDMRMRKLIFRAFALACGLADAQSIGSTMWPAADEKAFDELYFPDRPFPNLMIPILGHLQRLGIKNMTVKTYKEACQEGWAPQPKDQYQKAIWDKTHEIPSKPIKIEYNEKRDKGK